MLRSLSFVKSRSRGRCRPRWCPSPALWAQRDQPASLLTCRHWANPAQTCCRHPASSAALQVRRCSVSLPLPRSSYLHTPTASPACSMTCPIHRGQAQQSSPLLSAAPFCLWRLLSVSPLHFLFFKTELPQFFQASLAAHAFRLSPCTPRISRTDYFLFWRETPAICIWKFRLIQIVLRWNEY